MITAVSIFSCTNDYDPGLIENLGMKEQPFKNNNKGADNKVS